MQELSQYTALTARLEIAEKLLQSLQAAVRPESQVIADIPYSAVVKSKISDLAAEINDLKARIEYLKREIKREGERLNEFIERIDSESLKAVFRLKYVRNLTWAQIAEIIGYTEANTKAKTYRYIRSFS